MRVETFSALAYGAQGLVYWTYGNRVSASNGTQYLMSPVDINGNKTIIWDRVKTVNNEIKGYDIYFYDCEPLNQYPFKGYYQLDSNSKFIKSVSASSISGALITYIRKNNVIYGIIVSTDAINSQRVNVQFKSGFNERFNVFRMTPSQGMPIANNSVLFDLEPGGLVILMFQEK